VGIISKNATKIAIISYTGATVGYINKVLLFPNFLQTDQVGLANLLVSSAALFAQIASFGLNNVIARFFPYFENKEKQHDGFLFYILSLGFIGFLLVAGLFLSFKTQIQAMYSVNSPLFSSHIIFLIPLAFNSLFYSLLESYLRALQKTVVPPFINEIVIRLINAAIIVPLAINLISFDLFIYLFIGANSISAIILFLYTLFLKQWFFRPMQQSKLKRSYKPMSIYSLFSYLSNSTSIIINNIDLLMIAAFLNLSNNGIYTTMIFIVSVMMFPYRALYSVASPLVAKYWKQKNLIEMQSLYQKVSSTLLIAGLFIFMLIWINFDTLFHFIPEEYKAGKYVFLFLGIGKLYDMAAGINTLILVTSKKYKIDLIFTVLFIALTIISNYIMIPIYGMNGAALATAFSIFCINTVRIIYLKSKFNLFPLKFNFLTTILFTCIVIYLNSLFSIEIHFLMDAFMRTIGSSLLFLIFIYFSGFNLDINQYITKHIRLIVNKLH
jgi:O-antigen/teichoic acid export membrane protein